MPSEFPLFLLPMLVFNRVLKLITPFELVAISLCSKKSKMFCKAARSQLQCKNGTKEFTLKFFSKKEIRLKFEYYPSMEWVFKLECFPNINNSPPQRRVLQKFISIFRRNHQTPSYTRVTNDLFINTWVPTEDDTTSENSLQLFTTEECQTLNMNLFILHLSDILNVPLDTIELHFQNYIQETNERIIDLYFPDDEEKPAVKSLTLIGKHWNTPEDDEVVDSLLRRQKARNKLKLLTRPTDEFKFNSEYFQNKSNQLEMSHAHWVSFSEFLEMNTVEISLFNSTFTSDHLKLLFAKWNSGWTPKWKAALIEFFEAVDIDQCANESNLIDSFSNVRVHRQEKIKRNQNEETKLIRYCLCRSDGKLGVVSLEGDTQGYFHVFPDVTLNMLRFPHFYQ
ncbi:hypothetical protein CRE_10572 [Caenorhabditis remanei]|uniref:F-box domain-containing protein n=1 Tax=Caenorhabditis remanei TaxID=31234 RepID=E3N775_CAERE|nr:hypothetical protein CRE_10572 [Caenorhabditis remanei]